MRFIERLTGVLAILGENLLLDKTVEYLNHYGEYYWYVLLPPSVLLVVTSQVNNHVADVLIP